MLKKNSLFVVCIASVFLFANCGNSSGSANSSTQGKVKIVRVEKSSNEYHHRGYSAPGQFFGRQYVFRTGVRLRNVSNEDLQGKSVDFLLKYADGVVSTRTVRFDSKFASNEEQYFELEAPISDKDCSPISVELAR